MSEYPGYYSSAPNSTKAIITLVAGILGVTFFPLVGSIVAVILGPMAKREIDESGGTLGGKNLAQIGLILGWIGLGLSLCGCCIAVGVFGSSFIFALFGISQEGFSLILPTMLFF
ncbi:DUF4190 domain-containing protein [Chloroflexota bacterium]